MDSGAREGRAADGEPSAGGLPPTVPGGRGGTRLSQAAGSYSRSWAEVGKMGQAKHYRVLGGNECQKCRSGLSHGEPENSSSIYIYTFIISAVRRLGKR